MKKSTFFKMSVFSVLAVAFAFYLVYYSNALANGNNDNCVSYDNFFNFSEWSGKSSQDSLIKTFDVNAKGSLFVDVPGADISIDVWDRNQVKVVVIQKGSEDQIKNYKISFNASADKVEIIAKTSKNFWNWSNMHTRFKILVPKQFYPDINTSGGDVTINNIFSDSKIGTSGGDIRISGCTGIVFAETSGGDITVKDNNGDVKLETSGGDIDLFNVRGKVSAETSGGDISLRLLGENKGIYLSTSGGDIKIKIPKDLKADLDCETSGGDVSMNGPSYFQGKMKDHSIKGSINGGGSQVKAETSGGDIVISLEN